PAGRRAALRRFSRQIRPNRLLSGNNFRLTDLIQCQQIERNRAKLVKDGDGTQTIDRNTSWSICEAVGEHLQQSLRPERSRLPPRLQNLMDELRRRESAKPR